MLPRSLAQTLHQRLNETAAVVLTGPRQVGKTTLALAEGESRDALYIDLESERDRAKLAEPELYLSDHFGRLVILDEVRRVPGLFPILRGLIDRSRHMGHRRGSTFVTRASFTRCSGSATRRHYSRIRLLVRAGKGLSLRTSWRPARMECRHITIGPAVARR